MSYLEALKHALIGTIIGVVTTTCLITVLSPKETVHIHVSEGSPCIEAEKAKYGCWPWDSCYIGKKPVVYIDEVRNDYIEKASVDCQPWDSCGK